MLSTVRLNASNSHVSLACGQIGEKLATTLARCFLRLSVVAISGATSALHFTN